LAFKKTVSRSPENQELDRILALPSRLAADGEDVEITSFESLSAESYDMGERQVDAVNTFTACRGGFFPIGVGFGKSGISLMVSQIAHDQGWARKILLMVPVHLVNGLMKRHIPEWRKRTNLSLQFHVLAGQPKAVRKRMAESNAPGVYVMPYSLMSSTDANDLLSLIDADMIVSDEAHKLKNPRSACTKRVMHFIKNRETAPICVFMSGSMTTKSVMDYHHLIDAALGEGSPLPRKQSLAFTWGMVIDSNGSPSPGLVANTFSRIITWANDKHVSQKSSFNTGTAIKNARNAFRQRLTTTPGVVATADDRPSASLTIDNWACEDYGMELTDLIRRAKEEFVTPQGEPIDHAIHVYKWLRELSSGFYNSLIWPDTEVFAKNRRISYQEAGSRITRSTEHLTGQQAYHSELRDFFKDAPIGLDTPTDVGLAIHHGKVALPSTLTRLWHEVKRLDFEGRPDRISVPIMVDDFKVQAVVKWAKEHKTGIVWVYHRFFGEWIMEALTAAGLNPVHAPSGADEAIESIGDPGRNGKGNRLVVASIPAHGVGRNLQKFENQLFAEWPRSPMLAEQSLGRVHRTGQEKEEVIVHTLIKTQFDEINRAATLNDAAYAMQTLGAAQRVLYADYTEQPRVYHPGALKAAGAAPLSDSQDHWEQLSRMFS
jgi:hypothetical protein